jgi:DNA polymerase I-like protein with 3'-5' exonuclease and polymerase domains
VYNYIEVYDKNRLKPFEIQAAQGLLNQGFVRDMSEDKEGDFGLQKMCFVKATDCAFISVDFQGNLFTGFDTKPKCTINWGSSKQVIKFLKLLGFNLKTFDKATKKEKESVDAKIIKAQLDVSPIAEIYLKYKEADKVVSTYGENWIKAINPITGRIHPDYYQLGTDTGRLSCGGGLTGVNVQNIPHDKETRACFIASKGYKWISADYQGQESRIIASVSDDQAMIDLFTNGCGDVHSLVAKMSYPDKIGDCEIEKIKDLYPDLRSEAKGVEFAINPI